MLGPPQKESSNEAPEFIHGQSCFRVLGSRGGRMPRGQRLTMRTGKGGARSSTSKSWGDVFASKTKGDPVPESVLEPGLCRGHKCGSRIDPKYQLCRSCFNRVKRLRAKQVSPEEYEKKIKDKLRMPAKNRKKSKIIDKLLAEPTNRAEPVQTVVTARPIKTILRKAGSGTL